MTVPLVALAIPSVLIGALTVGPVLFGGYFGHAIFVLPANDVTARVGADFGGAVQFALHGMLKAPFWFAALGVAAAWYFFLKRPELADESARRFRLLYRILCEQVLLRLGQRERAGAARPRDRYRPVEGR